MLNSEFFDQDACSLACNLLGKIIRRKYKNQWLAARIIETEAYYLEDKGSHASLGMTARRKALFMPAGTIYMYYARGKDSLNVSCAGQGNAVLIKSAYPYVDQLSGTDSLVLMQQLNPSASGKIRTIDHLCKGQTLLCQSMNLKVHDWDQQQFDASCFYFEDISYQPGQIIQTTRLGIPEGRDEHLHYRFIDYDFARHCTRNPLTIRNWKQNHHYSLLSPSV
ncbi:MAG: DNA-3-methyladenine glycosylase [Gammaproteobacteria bacterium]|nr:DNA-3-methyladenine glycosylase [Gammaproteobacteria bacterium]MDH5734577.1 DNA-3-methyladenine glycosylase [Gammaproteobacteria bacterium]